MAAMVVAMAMAIVVAIVVVVAAAAQGWRLTGQLFTASPTEDEACWWGRGTRPRRSPLDVRSLECILTTTGSPHNGARVRS